MATGSAPLLTARAALGASEAASTTPTRYLYFGSEDNVDLGGIQQVATIEDSVAWAKRDQLRALYPGIESNVFAVNNVPTSYEDVGFILSQIPGIVSGAGTGAGTPTTTDTSAYTRTFTPSQSVTAWGPTGGYDMHLQVGYADLISTIGWSVPGLRLIDFTLNWKKRASGADTGLTYSAIWATHKACTQITAFTGSLSDRTQTFPTGNVVKSYVDTTTIGTTADANITEATFHLASLPAFHDGLDNSGVHTSMHFPNKWDMSLDIVRKFSDLTEQAAYLAKTTRKVRLIAEGAVVGAATAKNTITLNYIGQYDTRQEVRIDGLIYEGLTARGVYDSTQLASWSFTSINAVSAAYTTA